MSADDRIEVEITPEELEELLREIPRMIRELTE
jgi:hypothetical protein